MVSYQAEITTESNKRAVLEIIQRIHTPKTSKEQSCVANNFSTVFRKTGQQEVIIISVKLQCLYIVESDILLPVKVGSLIAMLLKAINFGNGVLLSSGAEVAQRLRLKTSRK